MNNTQCRLLNPAKSDMGKISKVILSRVVESIRSIKRYNQWKNSFSVINWFNALQGKKELSFIEFDIVDFYPSITEKVLNNA